MNSLKINIYILSDKFNKFYNDAISEYEKRLRRYCKINLFHFKLENDLINKLPSSSYKIYISANGRHISSEELAEKISRLAVTGKSNISFVITNRFAQADETISISPMNMAEGLLTTIIYEQIYRAYRIINNQAYHK